MNGGHHGEDRAHDEQPPLGFVEDRAGHQSTRAM